MTFSKKQSILGLVLFMPSLAFAAGGTGQDVNSLFSQILSILQGLSVVVVTIAVIWAGYKILFKGAQLGEVAGPLLGAIMIGAAPWLAEILVG